MQDKVIKYYASCYCKKVSLRKKVEIGNTDFAKAEETIKKALDEMHMEEIEKFIEMFLPAYTKTLDEISK